MLFSNLMFIATVSGFIGAILWIVLQTRYSKLKEFWNWVFQTITALLPMIVLLPLLYKALVASEAGYLIAGGVGVAFWVISLTLTNRVMQDEDVDLEWPVLSFIFASLIGLIATVVAWANGL